MAGKALVTRFVNWVCIVGSLYAFVSCMDGLDGPQYLSTSFRFYYYLLCLYPPSTFPSNWPSLLFHRSSLFHIFNQPWIDSNLLDSTFDIFSSRRLSFYFCPAYSSLVACYVFLALTLYIVFPKRFISCAYIQHRQTWETRRSWERRIDCAITETPWNILIAD